MTSDDWRSPARYEDLRSLDGPGFAWEYLRRNTAFSDERAPTVETSQLSDWSRGSYDYQLTDTTIIS
jgi:hypothetical protein